MCGFALNQEIEKLKKQSGGPNEENNAKIQELEKELKESKEKIKELERTIEQLEGIENGDTKIIRLNNEKITNLTNERDNFKNQVTQLQNEKNSLQQQIGSKTVNLYDKIQDIARQQHTKKDILDAIFDYAKFMLRNENGLHEKLDDIKNVSVKMCHIFYDQDIMKFSKGIISNLYSVVYNNSATNVLGYKVLTDLRARNGALFAEKYGNIFELFGQWYSVHQPNLNVINTVSSFLCAFLLDIAFCLPFNHGLKLNYNEISAIIGIMRYYEQEINDAPLEI